MTVRALVSLAALVLLGCARDPSPPSRQAPLDLDGDGCGCDVTTPGRAYTWVDDGSTNTYRVGPGQSLCLRSGTFTGAITTTANSTVCVARGARLELPLLELAGTLVVHGSAGTRETPLGFVFSEGARLDNHGLTTVGLANFNGPTTLTNAAGATLEFRSSFALRAPGSTLENRGLLRTLSNFDSMAGTTLTNIGVAFVRGELALDGMTQNRGLIEITTRVNLNADADLDNTCTLLSHGPYNVSGRLANAGLAYLVADRGSLELNVTSPGRITQTGDGLLLIVSDDGPGGEHQANLRLDGGLQGRGVVLVEDLSVCQGDGFAVADPEAPLVFFDLTPSQPDTLFDLQTGRVEGILAGTPETKPRLPTLDEARAARIGSDCATSTGCVDDQPAGLVDTGCARPLPVCLQVDTVNLCVECAVDSECPPTWTCRGDTFRCAPPPPPPPDPVADPDPTDTQDGDVDTVNADGSPDAAGDVGDDTDPGPDAPRDDASTDDATLVDGAPADLLDPGDTPGAEDSGDAPGPQDDLRPVTTRRGLIVEGGGCAGGTTPLTPAIVLIAALALHRGRRRRSTPKA